MKRLLIATLVTAGLAGGALALPLSHGAYCYPTSAYWQKQLSNPNNAQYYAHNNAYYLHAYGPASHYCI